MKPWLLIPIVGFLNNTNRKDGLYMDRVEGFRERKMQREKEMELERTM